MLWNKFSAFDPFTKTVVTVVLLILLITPVIVTNPQLIQQNASSATVTVSNTTTGTFNGQLSTNIVTWASDFSQIPNGQTNFNALHAPFVRLHMGDDGGPTSGSMPEVQKGTWDMGTIDQMVSDVYASGQQPLMNIKYAPDWMWTCYPNSLGMTGGATQGTGTITDQTFQTFAQYMARLVSYYNKGSLTEENGTVLTNSLGTQHKITYWELWNEPDLNNETPCAPSSGVALTPAQYLTMWNAVTAAMLAVDPTIKFVGPAGAGGQFGSGSQELQYVANIMGSSSNVKPYAISEHPYGDWQQDPDTCFFDGTATVCGGVDSGKGIGSLMQGLTALHTDYPTMPIWLTEVNVNADWSAQGQNDNELGVAWWGSFLSQLAPLNIGVIHQYDLTGSNLFGLIDGEGINNNQPTGKPMLPYYMVQAFDSAFPQGSTLLQSNSVQSGIQSLAVKKPDGTISVMVINRTVPSTSATTTCGNGGSPETVTVDLSALSPSSIQLTQIDKNNINCTSFLGIAPTTQTLPTANTVTLTFPGYGIAILNVATNGVIFPTPTFTPTPTPGTNQITGTVWIDTNANNTKDTGEPSYTSGATVMLSGAASATTVSDGTGKYSFTGLSDGTYTVAVTAPAGYTADPSKNRTLSASNSTANLGLIPNTTTPTAIPSPTLLPPTASPTPKPPTATPTPLPSATPVPPTATTVPTAVPSPTGSSVPGDANGDGHVDLTDFSILASEYGQSGNNLPADFNHDGIVDLTDFSILASHYGI